MTDDFTPRLDILPKPQRQIWDELAAVPPEFVLYGGTAVALHLGHRQSLDFDFFGNRSFDPALLTAAIPFMAAAHRARQRFAGGKPAGPGRDQSSRRAAARRSQGLHGY